MSTTDETLLARISDGDAQAFSALYDRHAARVLGFLVRMLRDRTEADDVLQATFLQVWRSAVGYRATRGTASAWLRVIARSRALDALRRRKPEAPLDAAPEPTISEASGTRAEDRESATEVRGALAQLPNEQSQAVHLAFFMGLTHGEVAEHMDVPLGTAKTWIRRGMESMRATLDSHEGVSA